MSATAAGFGPLLRDWRRRRRLTQLDLGLAAGVSTRHLSFVETGRSRPSPAMVVSLADALEVPLRERNALLLAAGHAPAYGHRDLDEPELAPIRAALDSLLRGHEPFPALAIDRHWGLVAANGAAEQLLTGVDAELLAPPANVARLSLHPGGLAPRIANLAEWRAHLLHRVLREAEASGDPALAALHEELAGYPCADGDGAAGPLESTVVVPLRLRAGEHELALLSAVTTFGAAADVTISELSIESFFPADERTVALLRDA